MIKASHISKSYGSLEVLRDINLEVKKGEIVSIVGASGAGKTTLLQILGTLDKHDGGSLEINGHNLSGMKQSMLSKFRNTQIGFVFQFHQLLPEFTAVENVCIPAFIKGEKKAVAEQKAKEFLSSLGLEHRFNHKPSELSGGEQQRVAVARALINNPAVIFADEPSGNLDSKSSEELHQLFFDLRNKTQQTFVIVTHNNTLADMADRKLTIVDGAIRE